MREREYGPPKMEKRERSRARSESEASSSNRVLVFSRRSKYVKTRLLQQIEVMVFS